MLKKKQEVKPELLAIENKNKQNCTMITASLDNCELKRGLTPIIKKRLQKFVKVSFCY